MSKLKKVLNLAFRRESKSLFTKKMFLWYDKEMYFRRSFNLIGTVPMLFQSSQQRKTFDLESEPGQTTTKQLPVDLINESKNDRISSSPLLSQLNIEDAKKNLHSIISSTKTLKIKQDQTTFANYPMIYPKYNPQLTSQVIAVHLKKQFNQQKTKTIPKVTKNNNNNASIDTKKSDDYSINSDAATNLLFHPDVKKDFELYLHLPKAGPNPGKTSIDQDMSDIKQTQSTKDHLPLISTTDVHPLFHVNLIRNYHTSKNSHEKNPVDVPIINSVPHYPSTWLEFLFYIAVGMISVFGMGMINQEVIQNALVYPAYPNNGGLQIPNNVAGFTTAVPLSFGVVPPPTSPASSSSPAEKAAPIPTISSDESKKSLVTDFYEKVFDFTVVLTAIYMYFTRF